MARKPAQRKPTRAAATARTSAPDSAAKGQTVRGGGRNISTDGQGRTIYYNGLFKKSFILKPSDQRIYTNLSARYFIALAVGIIVWGLSRSIPCVSPSLLGTAPPFTRMTSSTSPRIR